MIRGIGRVSVHVYSSEDGLLDRVVIFLGDGTTLLDYFLGLGVNAICTDIPVQAQKYIDESRS